MEGISKHVKGPALGEQVFSTKQKQMALTFTTKKIVDSHRLRSTLPIHKCIINYSLLHYAGNVRGKSVLDLACGEGSHLRMLKMNGAAKAVGVDISEEMLRRSRAVEDKNPLGCTFTQGDMRTMGKIGEFDLITCVMALPFSETIEDLKAICRNICLNLKKGGRFVGISYNCHVDPDWSENLAKYGIKIVPGVENLEGRRTVILRVESPDGKVHIVENFWYPFEVMDLAFQSAGFSNYSFEPAVLDPEIVAEYPDGFWDDYQNKPKHTIYVAYK